MVYSSAPLYLDPHNWHHHQQAQLQQHQQQLQQQQNQQQLGVTHGVVGGGENPNNPNPHHQQIAVQMQSTPVPSQAVGGGSSSSIRPGSMADRARQAKIPQPEPGLKCPRCESTNTKFCYFNNYSLTQPRHFCKMCRRYWTRGGALRNVPVGGGCRRNNKRSSKSGGGSKSAGGERQSGTGPSNNSTSPISSNSNNTEMNNNNSHGNNMLDTSLPTHSYGSRMTQFPLLASLQGLTHGQYGSPSSNLGLNFGAMMGSSAQGDQLGFPIGVNTANSEQQWRPHHFPNFLAGFDPPQVAQQQTPSSSLYHFPNDHHQSMDPASNNPPPIRSSVSLSAMNNQQAARPSSMTLNNNSTDQKNNEAAGVKPEAASGQGSGMNLLSSSFLGMSENGQYWAGSNNNSNNNNSTWTDLSGLNSSTSSLL